MGLGDDSASSSSKHEDHATLQPGSPYAGRWNDRRGTELMVRDAEVDSTAGHESEYIVGVEEFRREAVAAGENLRKRGDVMNMVSEFRSRGNVVEGGMVEAFERIRLVARPRRADIARYSEPG